MFVQRCARRRAIARAGRQTLRDEKQREGLRSVDRTTSPRHRETCPDSRLTPCGQQKRGYVMSLIALATRATLADAYAGHVVDTISAVSHGLSRYRKGDKVTCPYSPGWPKLFDMRR